MLQAQAVGFTLIPVEGDEADNETNKNMNANLNEMMEMGLYVYQDATGEVFGRSIFFTTPAEVMSLVAAYNPTSKPLYIQKRDGTNIVF